MIGSCRHWFTAPYLTGIILEVVVDFLYCLVCLREILLHKKNQNMEEIQGGHCPCSKIQGGQSTTLPPPCRAPERPCYCYCGDRTRYSREEMEQDKDGGMRQTNTVTTRLTHRDKQVEGNYGKITTRHWKLLTMVTYLTSSTIERNEQEIPNSANQLQSVSKVFFAWKSISRTL